MDEGRLYFTYDTLILIILTPAHDKVEPPNPEKRTKPVPTVPFRVLDAPNLRDDYYCSVLAYSPLTKILAVSLGNAIYF
jgi:hypothetical protein